MDLYYSIEENESFLRKLILDFLRKQRVFCQLFMKIFRYTFQ